MQISKKITKRSISSIFIILMLITTILSPFSSTAQEQVSLNNPPYEPTNPLPENNSVNISTGTTLSWTGGDPDNDTVTYDIYFGTTNTPSKIVSNHSNSTFIFTDTLQYTTTYFWRIVARDNHSATTQGPLWKFTTQDNPTPSVIITKPLEKTLYVQDKQKGSLPKRTIIYGPITITANATAAAGIAKVEFYVNGKLIGTDTTAPYSCQWKPIIQFNGASLTHTITVKAIDTLGNNATASINVTKWRFHILPWAAAAMIGITKITNTVIPHTTIRGFVFNLKRTPAGWSFFALRVHYNSVGFFHTQRGDITFKRCTIPAFIGTKTIKNFGVFQKTSWISFTCLGKIHITQGITPSDIVHTLC
ncbi:MAG: Ig-like domain-containing protein [Candidatus Thermoplasmatota archaeon]